VGKEHIGRNATVSDGKLTVSQIEQAHKRSEETGSHLLRKHDGNREPQPKEQVTDTTADYRVTYRCSSTADDEKLHNGCDNLPSVGSVGLDLENTKRLDVHRHTEENGV
jgi:hypothetical protein